MHANWKLSFQFPPILLIKKNKIKKLYPLPKTSLSPAIPDCHNQPCVWSSSLPANFQVQVWSLLFLSCYAILDPLLCETYQASCFSSHGPRTVGRTPWPHPITSSGDPCSPLISLLLFPRILAAKASNLLHEDYFSLKVLVTESSVKD